VVKWAGLLKRQGDLKPGKVGGHRPTLLEPHRDFILARIQDTPHLTLHRLADLLAARGVQVSHDTVWRFLRAEGLSFKNVWPAPLASRLMDSLDRSCKNVSGISALGPLP